MASVNIGKRSVEVGKPGVVVGGQGVKWIFRFDKYFGMGLDFGESRCIFIVETFNGATIMKLKIKKWGNSLAIRIPRAFAMETNLHNDSVVEFFSRNNELVIVPVDGNEFRLADLLEQVNEGNLHGEITAGAPVGAELW